MELYLRFELYRVLHSIDKFVRMQRQYVSPVLIRVLAKKDLSNISASGSRFNMRSNKLKMPSNASFRF